MSHKLKLKLHQNSRWLFLFLYLDKFPKCLRPTIWFNTIIKKQYSPDVFKRLYCCLAFSLYFSLDKFQLFSRINWLELRLNFQLYTSKHRKICKLAEYYSSWISLYLSYFFDVLTLIRCFLWELQCEAVENIWWNLFYKNTLLLSKRVTLKYNLTPINFWKLP